MDYLSDDLGGAAQLVESAEDGLMRSIIAEPMCSAPSVLL